MIVIEIKFCNICKETKALTDFYAQDRIKADGTKYVYIRPDCKKCTKINAMKWKKENPEKRKVNDNKYNSQPRNKITVTNPSRLRVNSKSFISVIFFYPS